MDAKIKNGISEHFPVIFPRFAPENIAGNFLFSCNFTPVPPTCPPYPSRRRRRKHRREGGCFAGKIFENVGWVRGTQNSDGGWGAYLWVLQNRIAFQSSTSAWWSTTNGIPVAITNVMVGSLGDYLPMSNVVDIGPHLDTATNNFPGANMHGEEKEYQVDISNVFYQLSIPDIWITPREALTCVGGSNVQFTVTGTNIPQGVNWTLIPSGLENGAEIQASNDWHYASMTPGNVGTNYKVRATSVDNTNFYDEVSLTVVKLDLTNMTFSAGWSLTRDTGGTYPMPHWTSTNSSPYLYERSTKVNMSAVFKVLPASFSGNITISGDGPGSLDFTNVTVSASGGLATYPATDSTGTLTNYVNFWNPMQISWKYGINESPSYDAGSSSNMVYVCLADPSAVPTLYHTVVHLACSVGHATNEAQAVSNTWSQLTGHNFTIWDGRTLYYYQSGIAWASNITDVSGLLANGNGQCNSWRELLEKAWLVNGVISTGATVSTVANPGSEIFLVKNWGFNTPTLTNDPPFNYVFLITASNGSMVGVGNFGDVNNLSGIPGQNSSTPAEKAFGYHFIQKYGGIYYDPSYGAIYTNDADFQAQAVAGFGEINPDNPNTNFPGMVEFGVKQTTNTVEVKIVP